MKGQVSVMFKHNAIALAVSGLSVLTGCSTVSAPERPVLPARAGTVEPVMTVRNSGGVDSDAMYRIGRYYQGQARHEDAAVAYRKALALDSRNVEARNALAVVYAMQGRVLDSEREFKAAIAQSPGVSHLYSNLGYHYLQLGRTDEARAALREAIRLAPTNARALANLALAEGDVAAPVARAPAPEVATAAPIAPAATVAIPVAPAAAIAAPVPSVAVTTAPVVPAVAPLPAAEGAPMTLVASSVPSSAPAVLPAVFEAKPAATIAELIGTRPVAPKAELIGLAPNVWQLRPRAAEVAAPPAPILQIGIVQSEKAIPARSIPAIVRFEISNGNGITGLARRVAGYLQSLGMNSPRLTNLRPFDQRRTQIQYVQGMEDSARDLRTALGTPADLVVTPRIERNAQLRVVLGRDFHEIEAVARMRSVTTKQLALAPGAEAR